MRVKRLVVPVAVAAVGGAAAVAGIVNAGAAVTTGCAVTYTVANQWNSGFSGDVRIRNTGGAAIDGWTLTFAFPSSQRVGAGWNRTIVPGATVTLGFNGVWSGGNTAPTAFSLNGATCNAGAAPTPSVSKTPTVAPTPSVSRTPTAAPTASLSKPPTAAPTPSASKTPTPTKGAEQCADFAALTRGKYWINNNTWGKADGAGSQCVWENGLAGESLSWGTEWTWSGDPSKVKSYASAVLGWHWGWKAAGAGLPVRLADRKPVRASWNFAFTRKTAGAMNVAYDLWLHDVASPDWQNQPSDEVMVWLYREGGAGPLGVKQGTVTIAGTAWDLYRGNIGWNVLSYVRSENTTSAALNLTDFTDDLAGRGWLDKNKYLSSVQAGAEVFTGSGRLDTAGYSVTIG